MKIPVAGLDYVASTNVAALTRKCSLYGGCGLGEGSSLDFELEVLFASHNLILYASIDPAMAAPTSAIPGWFKIFVGSKPWRILLSPTPPHLRLPM